MSVLSSRRKKCRSRARIALELGDVRRANPSERISLDVLLVDSPVVHLSSYRHHAIRQDRRMNCNAIEKAARFSPSQILGVHSSNFWHDVLVKNTLVFSPRSLEWLSVLLQILCCHLLDRPKRVKHVEAVCSVARIVREIFTNLVMLAMRHVERCAWVSTQRHAFGLSVDLDSRDDRLRALRAYSNTKTVSSGFKSLVALVFRFQATNECIGETSPGYTC